ncbi:class I SAM-dependent methyltransferase [Pseudonocardia bannensis]|uniref:Methyltransferase domain-containing protein n=1 Tax=Pseudonocardia bannensis TaxID=630973 RepID=A0A848DD61_9PSEU|nr:methyltransferase domain-containing protein [Pseudonocardia bannensis]NMH90530.1 methyltransferase domain-containing protein [Pseudonocardia bannensis]
MRLEIGAGEKPHPDYDVHVDMLALPDIEVRCSIDRLPFASGSMDALRANHVLEHQSYELIDETLCEWARVLCPGARLDIGVPDAKFVARQWVAGEIGAVEANHWILGGHSERAAHRGVDAKGVPLWIWNAHHTMFDARSLHAAVSAHFEVLELFTYDIRNLRCYARKP